MRDLISDFYNSRYSSCLAHLKALRPALALDIHLHDHAQVGCCVCVHACVCMFFWCVVVRVGSCLYACVLLCVHLCILMCFEMCLCACVYVCVFARACTHAFSDVCVLGAERTRALPVLSWTACRKQHRVQNQTCMHSCDAPACHLHLVHLNVPHPLLLKLSCTSHRKR